MKSNNFQLRHVLLVILFLGIQGLCSAQTEEEQIKKVIIGETEYYFARDLTRWNASFVANEKTAVIQKYSDGELFSVVGFDKMEALTKKSWEENPEMDFKIKSRLKWNISIKGEVAWVNFKQLAMANDTELHSEEIRVLVKEKNYWKIAFMSSIF